MIPKIKLSGIYMILHGKSEHYYIGLSQDIFSRWQNHYTDLKMNRHSSTKLQDLFNQTGDISDFTFTILEYVSITDAKKSGFTKDGFRKLLLMKEKEHMRNHSINFSLNKDDKYFSK
jgi:hypothetical protein